MTVRDGNGDRGRNEHRHAELAQRPPQITVLSDGALLAGQANRDTFDLWAKLGPIYDIIRHPDTETPIAIGVFGRWGSGKTTAMRWLQGSLEVWNEQGESTGNEPKISVRTVWFDPWKYDSREDVWRGLLAEVILASLEGKSGADAKKVLRDFGRLAWLCRRLGDEAGARAASDTVATLVERFLADSVDVLATSSDWICESLASVRL